MSTDSDTDIAPSRSRGRPRQEAVDASVRGAFLELVAEQGYPATSMDQVADRAGVAKTTIYRRWPSKEALFIDVHRSMLPSTPPPDTGSLEGDLRATVDQFMTQLDDPRLGRLMQATTGEMLANEDVARIFRQEVLGPRFERVRTIFERAESRGELPPGADWESVAMMLFGANMFRTVIMGLPPSRDAAMRIVSLIATSARASQLLPAFNQLRRELRRH